MNTPSHEEIAQKAYEIWQERGSLHGTDQEIWLEAERALNEEAHAKAKPAQSAAKPKSQPYSPAPTPAATAAEPTPAAERVKSAASTETTIKAPTAAPSPEPDHEAALAALQKEAARAPQVPHHTGPKTKPAPTGKPVWNKPHSS